MVKHTVKHMVKHTVKHMVKAGAEVLHAVTINYRYELCHDAFCRFWVQHLKPFGS